MSKTDKELTAEIVIAMLNANPRDVYKNGNQIIPSIGGEGVVNLITGIYNTFKKLD